MKNIYRTHYYIKVGIFTTALLMVAIFLSVSTRLMNALEQEERSKMEIWAKATSLLASQDTDTDMSLVLKVIQSNTTIPVVIMDNKDRVLWHINCDISKRDSVAELQEVVERLKDRKPIEVVISRSLKQYLYYDDSILLKQLQYYPYIQLAILFLFIVVTYWAFKSSQRAEQNRVWVGLSKETAHQLGTPISSMMAWIDYLRSMDTDPMVLDELDKDVRRLNTIADRFSKIGSQPKLEVLRLQDVVEAAVGYMRKRISAKVSLTLEMTHEVIEVKGSVALLEWVIENLLRNAVDATNGSGSIHVEVGLLAGESFIKVTDNGRGILRKHFQTIFHPGFTTKKRGWGLGLTLTKRIIEQYHGGNIVVVESVPFERTTLRISLPLIAESIPAGEQG